MQEESTFLSYNSESTFSDNVETVHFTDSGAFQAVEDLCSRPTAETISKRVKIQAKRSSASRDSGKAMRRQRLNTVFADFSASSGSDLGS